MLARTRSIALTGVDARLIDVRAELMPGATQSRPEVVVSSVTRETVDRVRAAIRTSGCAWPFGRVVITCPSGAPDTSGDLAVAIAVLVASGVVPSPSLAQIALVGELALNAELRPVRGILPRVLAARNAGCSHVVVPAANAAEAVLLDGIAIVPAATLAEVHGWLAGYRPAPAPTIVPRTGAVTAELDVADLRVDSDGIRAMEVAAAGGHHVLCLGHTSSGATLLPRLLASVLPDLSAEQSMAVTAIYSASGALRPDQGLIARPPLAQPHHTISLRALLGGGPGVRPGAVSLAHHGVLHLEDAPEFSRGSLDALIPVLDSGEVILVCAQGSVRLPAQIQLTLTAHACPCDALDRRDCVCTPAARARYQRRLPPRLLTRIGVAVRLRDPADIQPCPVPRSMPQLRAQVQEARARSARRWAEHGALSNAAVPAHVLQRSVPIEADSLLDDGVHRGELTGRSAEQCLRVAWTFADLDGRDHPSADDVAAALDLRRHLGARRA